MADASNRRQFATLSSTAPQSAPLVQSTSDFSEVFAVVRFLSSPRARPRPRARRKDSSDQSRWNGREAIQLTNRNRTSPAAVGCIDSARDISIDGIADAPAGRDRHRDPADCGAVRAAPESSDTGAPRGGMSVGESRDVPNRGDSSDDRGNSEESGRVEPGLRP